MTKDYDDISVIRRCNTEACRTFFSYKSTFVNFVDVIS